MKEKIPADREDLRKMYFVANTLAYQKAGDCQHDRDRISRQVNEELPAFNAIYATIHDLFEEKTKNDTEEVREAIKSAYIEMAILYLLHPLTLRWVLTYLMDKNETDFIDLSLTLMKQTAEAIDPETCELWQNAEAEYSPELAELLDRYLEGLLPGNASAGPDPGPEE